MADHSAITQGPDPLGNPVEAPFPLSYVVHSRRSVFHNYGAGGRPHIGANRPIYHRQAMEGDRLGVG